MDVIRFLFTASMVKTVTVWGLQCWSCIGLSCDIEETNENMKQMSCLPGEACQKVEYIMEEPNSSAVYISTVRSCSSGPCIPTNTAEFPSCIGNFRLYNVFGCATRNCCNNLDLCNGGWVLTDVKLLWVICLSVMLLIMYQ